MRVFITLFALFWATVTQGQIRVSTLLSLDASGGVTYGPDRMLYVSDFGPQLGPSEQPTSVYRVNPATGEYTVFASGFDGASGAAFDAEGNFYQAEPRGNKVTRINQDGSREIVADNLNIPVGVQLDNNSNIYVCNCGTNEILKFDVSGTRSVFASDPDLMACPNGLTIDDAGNLYAVMFGAGNVVKISAAGEPELLAQLPTLSGGPNPIGLGHITWYDGQLYITGIGTGVIFQMADDGSNLQTIAGIPFAFSNLDGDSGTATFSKPNGIAISDDGKRLFVNVSEPAWPQNATALHPAAVRVIEGY